MPSPLPHRLWVPHSPRAFLAALALTLAFVAALSARAATLDADTRLVLDASAPPSVRAAAADIARDLRKIFGRPAAVVTVPSPTAPLPAAPGVTLRVLIDPAAGLAPETFRLGWAAPGADSRTLELRGADARGAIYALYEFSSRVLGVDPWWFWTDHEPAARARIELPADFAVTVAPPAFRYRGWFINDEDLLAGWRPDPMRRTAISPDIWEMICETILRLRGNMIAPGTFPFPDEPQFALAARRGLVLNQHHQTPLGFVGYRWPTDRVYSPTRDMAALARAWEHCVRLHPADAEVVWTTGLRAVNRNDAAFWASDPHAPTDPKERAAIIQRAMEEQVAAVTRVRGPGQRFITNLWHEGVEMVKQGSLKLPPEVTRVWPDDGYGHIRDGGTITAGEGVYYHTAYMNGHANQLTEMVAPALIWSELSRALRAGATEFLLNNVSDVRPVPLTTDALMQIAWDGPRWFADATDRPAAFLRDWLTRQYRDPALAAELAALHTDYFAAHLTFTGGTVKFLGDHAYFRLQTHFTGAAKNSDPAATTGQLGIRIAPLDTPLDAFLATFLPRATDARARWAELERRALALRSRVPADRLAFYDAHVVAQIRIHVHGLAAMTETAAAARALRAGEKSTGRTHATAALAALDATLATFRAAETAQWDGYYAGDAEGFVHVTGSRDLALDLLHWIDTGKNGPERPGRSGAAYQWLQSYQSSRTVEIPAAQEK